MTTADDAVELLSTTPVLRIPRERVYFSFGSGRFGYNCESCNAMCCRGFGYSIQTGHELRVHLKSRPSIALFVDSIADSGAGHIGNLPPSCFFLNRQNLCSIQLDHGYQAKPETCRLFPFNWFSLCSGHLIVTPHPWLCPLEVVDGDRTDAASQHDRLFHEMSAGGIAGEVSTAKSITSDVPALVALERQLLGLAERSFGDDDYLTFVEGMLQNTQNAGVDAALRAAAGSTPHVDVRAVAELMCLVLGVTPAIGRLRDGEVHRTVVATTPTIRATLAFGEVAVPASVNIDRIPYVCLALYLIAGLAKESGMQAVTYQTVMRLFTNYQSVLMMVANSDRVMAWSRSANIDLAFPAYSDFQQRYVRIVRALLRRHQRTAHAPLGEILCQYAPEDVTLRLPFLRLIASRLIDGIEPLTEGDGRRRPGHLRARLHQWALRIVDDDFLVALGERERRRQLPA